MKKIFIKVLCAVSAAAVIGCSGIEESTPAVIMTEDAKNIHVTFAENSHIKVSYYNDSELTDAIETEDCYIGSEDCIYASEPKIDNTISSYYVFEGFRIFEYDENGERTGHDIAADSGNNIYVIRLQMNSSAAEVSVEPVGRFTNRTLTMSDYYTDMNGNKKELAGTWSVNENKFTSEKTEIEPNIPYSVRYKYDPDEYYFCDSEPKHAALNESEGIVYFYRVDASDNINDFSVRLSKYTTAYIENPQKIARISIEGEYTDSEDVVYHLKAGDTIEMLLEDRRVYCDEIDTNSFEKVLSGYSFVYHVPDNTPELHFKVRDWHTKTITFDLDADILDKVNVIGAGWFASDTEKLLTVRAGDVEKNLKQLKGRSSLSLKESDKLEIIVSEDIKNFPDLCFVITANGKDPEYISASSERKYLTFDYGETDSIKIAEQHKEENQ